MLCVIAGQTPSKRQKYMLENFHPNTHHHHYHRHHHPHRRYIIYKKKRELLQVIHCFV